LLKLSNTLGRLLTSVQRGLFGDRSDLCEQNNDLDTPSRANFDADIVVLHPYWLLAEFRHTL
jgi:hypothetical protein